MIDINYPFDYLFASSLSLWSEVALSISAFRALHQSAMGYFRHSTCELNMLSKDDCAFPATYYPSGVRYLVRLLLRPRVQFLSNIYNVAPN